MCQFYSPIVTRELKILDCVEQNDSHEDVIEKYRLKDDKLKNRDFVRLEINPKDDDIFNHKISNWIYREDEIDTLPNWYKKNKDIIKKKCYAKLRKVFKKQFLVGGKYKVINRNVRFLKNVKIEVLRSKVNEMWGSSQVGEMWGSSQVGEMWDSSQVGEMWGSSQVGEMWGSSQVGEMWDSSQVGEMSGNSTVNIWSKNVKIKQRKNGKSVVIKRYLDKVKVSIK